MKTTTAWFIITASALTTLAIATGHTTAAITAATLTISATLLSFVARALKQ